MADAAAATVSGDVQKNDLFMFSSTCYYFGESLVESLRKKATKEAKQASGGTAVRRRVIVITFSVWREICVHTEK